ncbi:MAG: hypothetical protein JW748_03500 [Anaerolineales bacterium]|nr:hypothetical protein [Anaerolineales bacterium]
MARSMDWRWNAYVTGSVDESGAYPEGGVILHRMNLLTGEVRDVATVIPEDYYARLERLVKASGKCYAIDFSYCMPIAIRQLNGCTHSLKWSPDGKYLAFGAMIDGDSSDVYVYDVDTGKIRRVESGTWNVGNL